MALLGYHWLAEARILLLVFCGTNLLGQAASSQQAIRMGIPDSMMVPAPALNGLTDFRKRCRPLHRNPPDVFAGSPIYGRGARVHKER